MNNDFGYSSYCTSGSPVISANYLAMTGKTVELDDNFPYSYATYQQNWTQR